jgi:hypothetical protein
MTYYDLPLTVLLHPDLGVAAAVLTGTLADVGARTPSGDPEDYCLKCLGPGGYRRLIDRARARVAAGEHYDWLVTCRSCGGPSVHGAVLQERAKLEAA